MIIILILTEFGLLSSLQTLHRTNKRLNGKIPLELSALAILEELRLSNDYSVLFSN